MTHVLEHGCLADAYLASHRLEFQSIDKAQFDYALALLRHVVANNRIYLRHSVLVRPIFTIVIVHLGEIQAQYAFMNIQIAYMVETTIANGSEQIARSQDRYSYIPVK